jgi:hypothetical protein
MKEGSRVADQFDASAAIAAMMKNSPTAACDIH